MSSHTLLIFVLDVGEWFYVVRRKRTPKYPLERRLDSPRARLKAAEKEKSLYLHVLKPNYLADQTCRLVMTLTNLFWLYYFSLHKTFLCLFQDCI